MIEAYAFLGAFAVQILATSVLYPAWFIRYLRARTKHLPVARLAQLYPGVDVAQAQERFLIRYRALNTGIAALGLLLLVWLFGYTQRPGWDSGPLKVLITVYFMVALMVPLGLVAWLGIRFNKDYRRRVPEGKRTAVLQRRGLFDFISPFVVALAVLCYLLFVAFVIYIREHPFPGFAGLFNIGGITLVYAVNALIVYMMLYGRNRNPLDTHAARLHAISVTVKSSVYSCIVIVVYLSLTFSLGMLDLRRWEPFVLSIFFVICALLTSMGVMRRPEAN
jgi:hypothetical protein